MMYEEYVDRVGELVTGIVQQTDSRYTLVELGRVEALLPKSEQVDNERYDHGARIKAVIIEVPGLDQGPAGHRLAPQRRARPQALRARGARDRRRPGRDQNVAREPGARRDGKPSPGRSKIAVISHADGVDPVGACVGPARLARAHGRQRAARREDRHHPVQRRAGALRRQGALAGARARGLVDDEDKPATIIVPDDQLSLAIGKEGQNARLASKLTGWRIDIKSEPRWPRPRPTSTTPTTTSPASAWR